jgi:hypothetical protein
MENETNEHRQDINVGKEGKEVRVEEVGSDSEGEKSPPKKKKRKEKKKRAKEAKAKEREATTPAAAAGASALKKGGKFSADAIKQREEEARKKEEERKAKEKEEKEKQEERINHFHTYRRVVLEASIVCSKEGREAKYDEFTLGIRVLFKQALKVDETVVFEPIEEGGKRAFEPSELPFDHTDLGNWVQKGGNKVFEMKKPKKNNKKNSVDEDEEALLHPEVYFTFALSCDMDPQKIVDRVSCEWGRIGGVRLWIKDISSFMTKTAFCLYHVRNDATADTIVAELQRLLDRAKDSASAREGVKYAYYFAEIPDMGIRIAVPKIDGMDTKRFQGWDGRQQFLRKVMHVECEEDKVQMVQSLIEEAKQDGSFHKMFGRNARASCVLEVKKGFVARKEKQRAQSKVDSAALASICHRHINYMSSTIYHGLTGIIDVDKKVPFYSTTDPTKEMGHFTFRHLLYNKFIMSDGQPLFWEVHQAEPMCPVDVVIPNWPEAERLVLMMNKNVAAFTTHFLGDKTKIDKNYLAGFVRETVFPEIVNSARDCEWDPKECSITTKEDREMENLQVIEAAAWYQDEWGEHMEDDRKGKKQYANKEELEDLNSVQTFKSVHQKQGNASKGAKVKSFQVGGEK